MDRTTPAMAYDKEQGDNGERIENCNSWANYQRHGIGICEVDTDECIRVLETQQSIILATCAGHRVTTRIMSHINLGLSVYFQTGEHYLKTRQMRENPRVAFSAGGYDFEGTAEIIGHPMDSANSFFLKEYARKFPKYRNNWSSLPEQVVVKVEVNYIRQWRYVDEKPYIAVMRIKGCSHGSFHYEDEGTDVCSGDS